jgi:hypothetical protein
VRGLVRFQTDPANGFEFLRKKDFWKSNYMQVIKPQECWETATPEARKNNLANRH